MQVNKPLRYIAYVRKSEERLERQELSLEAQINKIKSIFVDLNIIDIVIESRSAFKPNNRPEFLSIIKRIENGEAEGIVAWHPNRMSRNEVDSATVTYMLRGPLKDLKFCSYNFDNSAEGIMMLQMVMNQSQYESSKQGRDVKRGMEQKASNGERPGQVPQGYVKSPVQDDNGQLLMHKDKLVTRTEPDPERYDLVKRMWTMLLSGSYSAQHIWEVADKEWNFTTRKSRRIGGGRMSKSLIYKIFTNPFYAGYIPHNGELFKGNHQAMITLNEFDQVQLILGKKGAPRKGSSVYAYTGLITCGECGCRVVAKQNFKFVKRENKTVSYIHYYCTRKSVKRPCTQRKYTRVEDLDKEITDELSKYEILPEFRDLAIKILRRNHKIEVKDRSKIYEAQQKKRRELQKQLDSLVDMRTRSLLDDQEYLSQKNRIKIDLAKSDDNLKNTEERAEKWLDLTEKAFDFATYARVHFQDGNLQAKREILMTLGKNLELKDNHLYITPNDWLIPIENDYPALHASYLKVRTNNKAPSKVIDEALLPIFESWRAIWDSNPGHPA
jgi:site-specific DNA recombinase